MPVFIGLEILKSLSHNETMKTPPEADRILCELSYKCGCTRSGVEGEIPQLCPAHNQPPLTIRYIPRRSDGHP